MVQERNKEGSARTGKWVEGGWTLEGLNSGFQMLLGEQEVCRTTGLPPRQGQEGYSQCSWQSCSCPRHQEIPRFWFGHRAHTPSAPSFHTPPTAAVSAHIFAEHMKLLEGDYPRTALQPFCYLSRKEQSLLIPYQKLKSKLNVNKTLIESYSSAFYLVVYRNQIHLIA